MKQDAVGRKRTGGQEVPSRPIRRSSPRATDFLLALGAAIGIAAVPLVLVVLVLEEQEWRDLLLEAGKLSLQFFLVVLLGLVVTTALELDRARRTRWRETRDEKKGHIRRLIVIAHHVDQARLMIAANRSVATWTTEMREHVVPAHADLRALGHDLRTAQAAGEPVFDAVEPLVVPLTSMEEWFREFSDEFAQNKKKMSARQEAAEEKMITHEQLWQEMLMLPLLRDLVLDPSSGRYGEFRGHYVRALTTMRGELKG